jgi:hypothetical protein
MTVEAATADSHEYPEARIPAERIAEAFAVRFQRAPWDPREIVPAALTGAVLVFAVSQIVAAVVIALGEGFSGVAVPLITSAGWAEPVLAMLLLGSVLLSWNEVRSCSGDLEFLAITTDDLTTSDVDPGEAITRLYRSRFLASSAGVAILLAAAAAIAREVGVAMEQLPHPAGASAEAGVLDAQTWGSLIEGAGIALAVLVLATAGLVILRRLYRQARAALAKSERSSPAS